MESLSQEEIELYNSHFSTLKPPFGSDIFEKQYDFRELIGFAKAYKERINNNHLDIKGCSNCKHFNRLSEDCEIKYSCDSTYSAFEKITPNILN